MNHIHALQAKIREQEAQLLALQGGLTDLEKYLLSQKFWEDTTVQARDILHRIAEFKHAAIVAE
jgi:transcriptional regulator with GAF, ATPase, and Fis domain